MKLNDNKLILRENKKIKNRDLKIKRFLRKNQIINNFDDRFLYEDLFKMQEINYGEIKSILVN